MKALTVRQPWASLIAIGAKRIETRSWSTNYRGPLVIHASASRVPKKLLNELLGDYYFGCALGHLPVFPYGEVIAITELQACVPITAEFVNELGRRERAFGDYSMTGRFAWCLGEIQQLEHREAVKGSLGLWNWELSA